MAVSEMHLVWIDLEMTGLDPQKEKIIEMAMVVTNSQLEVIAQAPVWVIHQSDALLASMDEWNTRTHTKSGLVDKVKASQWTEAEVEKAAIAFLAQYIPKGKVPLCGNSIGQDRRFLNAYMPELEAFFHYRNVDVSTLKELSRRWAPTVYKGFDKKSRHEALADILESIEEMRYYRDHFMRIPSGDTPVVKGS